jgi:hypothetical protein
VKKIGNSFRLFPRWYGLKAAASKSSLIPRFAPQMGWHSAVAIASCRPVIAAQRSRSPPPSPRPPQSALQPRPRPQ